MATDSRKEELPPSEAKTPERPGLKEILEQLARLTDSHRGVGGMVVTSAGFALVGVIAGIVTPITTDQSSLGLPLLLGTLVVAAHGIVTLFLWDQRKRRGSLYYEEISDELEWRHTRARRKGVSIQAISNGSVAHIGNGTPEKEPKNDPPKVPESPKEAVTKPKTRRKRPDLAIEAVPKPKMRRKRPDLAIRLQLREFLDATTLPFTSANLSSTIYLTWFLFCIFAALFGLSLLPKRFG